MVRLYVSTGEVFDYLVAHGRMKEKEARVKFRQVKNNYIHVCSLLASVMSPLSRENRQLYVCNLHCMYCGVIHMSSNFTCTFILTFSKSTHYE